MYLEIGSYKVDYGHFLSISYIRWFVTYQYTLFSVTFNGDYWTYWLVTVQHTLITFQCIHRRMEIRIKIQLI